MRQINSTKKESSKEESKTGHQSGKKASILTLSILKDRHTQLSKGES